METEYDHPQESAVVAFNDYVGFIQQIELVGVWLRSSRVTNSTGGITFSRAEVSIEDSATWKDIEEGFQVFHKYKAVFTDGKKKLGRIEAEFVTDYMSDEPMNDECFDLFKSNNLPLNTWPYFREYVSNTTGRMQWLPFTLPTRKFLSTPTIAIPSSEEDQDFRPGFAIDQP